MLQPDILAGPKNSRATGIGQKHWRLYRTVGECAQFNMDSTVVKMAYAFTPLIPNELVPAAHVLKISTFLHHKSFAFINGGLSDERNRHSKAHRFTCNPGLLLYTPAKVVAVAQGSAVAPRGTCAFCM